MRFLKPKLATLQKEFVLVQAVKKTVGYIRSHNWFADILELDHATVNYPALLEKLQHDLSRSGSWKSQRVRLVPAPKSNEWWINNHGEWEPRPNEKREPTSANLRPLAHVPLRDQVIATALMMCVADRVETLQGDPRLGVRNHGNRKRVVSYGNRLFCDSVPRNGNEQLSHRWGSSKLYRAYYADYRTFISRPQIVAAELGERSNAKTIIVHSDLSKFYDRVRPPMLHEKLKARLTENETPFYKFAVRVLNWKWDERDVKAARTIGGSEDFGSLALPQGLVSSGFFANVVLLDFDDAMRGAFDTEIAEGIVLRDAARYVDDLRFVVEAADSSELKDVEVACHEWIEKMLEVAAPGLTANRDKTRAVPVHDPQRVMVFQSRRMRRIQEAVSGGFDANGGTQLLASLEGLFNTIGQFVETDQQGTRWPLKATPDVRDETVARFVAGRYRSTFRSLRPLLEDEIIGSSQLENSDGDEPSDANSAILTKDELDRQSQAFSLRLVEQWIRNPGNVRLLRVGLDLFPDASVLESVIGLLKPILTSPSDERGIRSVAQYCLGELFRAAATETGLVPDQELLPSGVNIEHYQDVLRDYSRELMAELWDSLPWYCRQQILLFVAASSPLGIDVQNARKAPETAEYATMLAFLQGQSESNLDRWTSSAVLARLSYLDAESATRLIVLQLTNERIVKLAELAPSVAEELLVLHERLRRLADKPVLNRLSLPQRQPPANTAETDVPLVDEARRWNCRLRDELSLVKFAIEWLNQRAQSENSFPPATMKVTFAPGGSNRVSFGDPLKNSLFEAPAECPTKQNWRFELGFVLRFIITGQSDPTETVRHPSWREHEHCYRPPSWHWRVRRYSLSNDRDRLGPEWIPLSSWMESFLSALLHWPGALAPPSPFQKLREISDAKRLCQDRVRDLESTRGEATRLLMLPVNARSTWSLEAQTTKPLRVCIAQLAVPEFRSGHATEAFGRHDPEFNAPATRTHYRRHLTAMLVLCHSSNFG